MGHRLGQSRRSRSCEGRKGVAEVPTGRRDIRIVGRRYWAAPSPPLTIEMSTRSLMKETPEPGSSGGALEAVAIPDNEPWRRAEPPELLDTPGS